MRACRHDPPCSARLAAPVQQRTGLQHFGDGGQCVRLARQKKWKCRFRPDQVGNAAQATLTALRQCEIATHDLRLAPKLKRSSCGMFGCMIRRCTPATISVGLRARRSAPNAPSAIRTMTARPNGSHRRGVSLRIVRHHRGTREHRNRDESEAPDAEHRNSLGERQRRRERVAERVPGKPGQHVAAQPFGRRQRAASVMIRHAPWLPQQARYGAPKPSEYGEPSRSSVTAKTAAASRKSSHRLEMHCRSNRARQGNTRSRTTIRPKKPDATPPQRAVPAPSSSQTMTGECYEHHRPEIDRRHRGERRGAASQKCDQRPAPTPSQNDRLGAKLRINSLALIPPRSGIELLNGSWIVAHSPVQSLAARMFPLEPDTDGAAGRPDTSVRRTVPRSTARRGCLG